MKKLNVGCDTVLLDLVIKKSCLLYLMGNAACLERDTIHFILR